MLAVKNLSIGSRVWLPVYVAGAGLAVGDLHFSQGDGEQSFCGCVIPSVLQRRNVALRVSFRNSAIEMSGIVTLKCSVVKQGVEKFALKQPIFLVRAHCMRRNDRELTELQQPSPIDPMYSQQLTFEGIGVGESV